MKLLTFKKNKQFKLGVKTNKGIIDIEQAVKKFPRENISTDIMDIIEKGQSAVKYLKEYIDELPYEEALYIEEENVDWGPAVTRPNKIICVGLNYKKHADETNSPYPKNPVLFTKYNNTLTGHKKIIKIPKVTKKLDYEVELGIVIGKRVKNVTEDDALEYVFGYTVTNDLSARDLQFESPQWLLGKSCDDFCPVGPFIVTTDNIDNPNNLTLKTEVNGEIRQQSNTSDMIFTCEEIVSYISKHMTLEPGDLILTGTPEGVVLGYPEEEQEFLKAGDRVTVEIEKIGRLTNKFVEEK